MIFRHIKKKKIILLYPSKEIIHLFFLFKNTYYIHSESGRMLSFGGTGMNIEFWSSKTYSACLLGMCNHSVTGEPRPQYPSERERPQCWVPEALVLTVPHCHQPCKSLMFVGSQFLL